MANRSLPYRLCLAVTLGAALMSSSLSAQTDEQNQAKKVCIGYQNELVALETPALRDRLKQDPQQVASGLQQDEIAKLKRLIELDELLMFRCRIGLKPLGVAANNAGNSALRQAVALPDLPVRRPKIARQTTSRSVNVPLPTRRSDAK